MRAILKSMAVAACALTASAAFAAPTITSASLTGPTGTIWNTSNADTYYTLFISRPMGNLFNPNDNFSGAPVNNPVDNAFDYSIAGDGFPVGTKSSTPSDPFYTLTLTLNEGGKTGTVSGVFTEATGIFAPNTSSFVSQGKSYTLSDFTWTRTLSNTVGAYSSTNTAPIGPGSRADYTGAFTISTTAVPEPATWAMMILGFGVVGGALRMRRGRKLVSSLA